MLPGLPTNLAPVSPAGGAAPAVGDARQVAFQRALGPLVGQAMQGKVLANLTDGTSLVSVAGSSVRMTIPGGAAVDSQVALRLVATDPRPTFQIGARQGQPAQLVYPELADGAPAAREQPQASAPTQIGAQAAAAAAAELRGGQPGVAAQSAGQAATESAQAAGQAGRPISPAAVALSRAPLMPASQLPGFDPSAPAPTLSSTARAIASVLSQAASGPATQQVLSGKVPLLQPGMDGEQLAQKLQNTVKASGLFYESHVADWAQGKHTLPDLRQEPQMQNAAQHASAQAGQAADQATGTDLASAQMINLQLHTHEQSRIAWHGEAWPGQKMEWDISRDPDGNGPGAKGENEEHRAWRSGVRFRMPTLGDISATVVLVGGQVHIQMQAASGDSAATLRLHAGALEQSLAAAGSPLSSFSVSTPAAPGENDAGAD